MTGNHFVKFGGDVRMIRMSTDQLGGITYTYANITGVSGEHAHAGPVFRRPERAEPVPQRRVRATSTSSRSTTWRSRRTSGALRPNLTLNYGLRYDYYVPLHEADNRIVKFNIDTGVLDPDTTPFYQSKKNNFQPRVSA